MSLYGISSFGRTNPVPARKAPVKPATAMTFGMALPADAFTDLSSLVLLGELKQQKSSILSLLSLDMTDHGLIDQKWRQDIYQPALSNTLCSLARELHKLEDEKYSALFVEQTLPREQLLEAVLEADPSFQERISRDIDTIVGKMTIENVRNTLGKLHVSKDEFGVDFEVSKVIFAPLLRNFRKQLEDSPNS